MGFVLGGKGVGHGFGVFLGFSFFLLFWQRLKLLVISEYQALGEWGIFGTTPGPLSDRVVSGTVSGNEANFPTAGRFLSSLYTCVRDK